MQRFWKGLAVLGVVGKKQRLYIWIPALAATFVLGRLTNHATSARRDIFDTTAEMREHLGTEMVYIHRSSQQSNLFHFADCKLFSGNMSAVGPVQSIYSKAILKPCPKCCIVTVRNDGTPQFWSWRHGSLDAPVVVAK